MGDLGFGIVDRRTVIAVLSALLLSTVLFHYELPLDTSSAVSFSLTFAQFVGFLILGRTFARIILAALSCLANVPSHVARSYKWQQPSERRTIAKAFHSALGGISSAFTGVFLSTLFVNRDWSWRQWVSPEDYWRLTRGLGFLGVADRLTLIALVVIATIPTARQTTQALGIAGLALLLAVFTLRGHYTFVLEDADVKSEERHREVVRAAHRPDIKFPSRITAVPPDVDYAGSGND
jgi:hypothetical protein